MVMRAAAEIDGPAWCTPGLGERGGRYPLSVEASVLSMVDTLVPGVSTTTRFVRYYALYWALADFAEQRGLDADTCRRVLRRAEVALTLASLEHDESPQAHGIDNIRALRDEGRAGSFVEPVQGSYSPRASGFWEQYNGASAVLGTVQMRDGALRPGRHGCPPAVSALFRPLLETVNAREFPLDDVAGLSSLALEQTSTPDLAPLRELFTATRNGRHDPDTWTGNDRTRRATLRLLARSVQLTLSRRDWVDAMRACVAYGDTIASDPVLSDEAKHAQSWRGTLLRHHSVGAWRRLWADLVNQVIALGGTATRDHLHQWISAAVPDMTVRQFVANCPPVVDHDSHPFPAEENLPDLPSATAEDLATLVLGGRRVEHLTGPARAAFLGTTSNKRGQFLDPNWVAYQLEEHQDEPVETLARAFVDDMLAQSRRVALRKMRISADGAMTLFSKLHERNGFYVATSREGSGNVGLRLEQLGDLANQLELVSGTDVTPLAGELLELPT